MPKSTRFTPENVNRWTEVLRRERNIRNMSQSELEEATGVSQSVISTLERGPYDGMRFIDILRLCDYFELPIGQLGAILGFDNINPEDKEYPEFQKIVRAYNRVPKYKRKDILEWVAASMEAAARSTEQK